MQSVKDEFKCLTPRPDQDLLQQLEEQVGSLTKDLSDLARDILSSEKEEEDLLDIYTEATLRKVLFDLSVQIKRLLQDRPSNPSKLESESHVKLSKIDVVTFDRNILRWNTF